VPIVAPFISAIAVIATLLFQMHQFNENSRLTRQTDEGVQFRAAIQSAKMPTGIQAYTSQALLTSFLKSETYGSQARVVAVSMMAGIGSPEGFRSLFESVFAKASYSDLPELARLSRMQNEIVGRAFDEKKRAEENLSRIEEPGSRSPNSSMAISSAKGQINQIQADIDSLGQQAAMTTSSIAAALKLKPSGEVSDLSALWLWGSDLSTISFGKASLDRTSIQNCDITNADFSEVTNFKESNWSQTAWWRAAKLNPALAEYLKANYPFDLKESYFGRPVTKEEYDGALAHFSIKP
jgi:hypothetical protein